MAILTWLGVPGTPDAWRTLGFHVDGDTFVCGGVTVQTGLPALEWGFDALGPGPERLGVPVRTVPAPSTDGDEHPNGATGIDHVVYGVDDLDAAVADVEAVLEIPLRRRLQPRGPEGPEMAFFRAGPAVIEVVGAGRRRSMWGLAFKARDLDELVRVAREAGGPVGDPKPAVQGGRICSVWKDYVRMPVAFMEPAASR